MNIFTFDRVNMHDLDDAWLNRGYNSSCFSMSFYFEVEETSMGTYEPD
jgi:hypothetical protein